MAEVMTQDLTATVDAYFAMWNEEDTTKRAQHIEEAWADNGRYVDPARDAEGHAALNDTVSAAPPHFPGTTAPAPTPSAPLPTSPPSAGKSLAPTVTFPALGTTSAALGPAAR